MPTDSCNLPLEAYRIERSIEMTVEGQRVTGIVSANYAIIDVTIASPNIHLTRGCNSRGWAFALLPGRRPNMRYVFRKELTARGLHLASETLADMYLDWLAVSKHEVEVAEEWRRRRQELEGWREHSRSESCRSRAKGRVAAVTSRAAQSRTRSTTSA
jgi:hypothetical protein